MDKWSIGVLLIIISSSVFAIFLRKDSAKEKDRLDKGELKAEDFTIIEG